jgi:hypothetical protein
MLQIPEQPKHRLHGRCLKVIMERRKIKISRLTTVTTLLTKHVNYLSASTNTTLNVNVKYSVKDNDRNSNNNNNNIAFCPKQVGVG